MRMNLTTMGLFLELRSSSDSLIITFVVPDMDFKLAGVSNTSLLFMISLSSYFCCPVVYCYKDFECRFQCWADSRTPLAFGDPDKLFVAETVWLMCSLSEFELNLSLLLYFNDIDAEVSLDVPNTMEDDGVSLRCQKTHCGLSLMEVV